jgi:hypothetical protein
MEHILPVFIPILALSIPVTAIVFSGMAKVLRLRIEEARIRHGADGGGEEVEALRDEVEQLRDELADIQERLDFTERLLIQKGASTEIGGDSEAR